jgi:hypothetical protein
MPIRYLTLPNVAVPFQVTNAESGLPATARTPDGSDVPVMATLGSVAYMLCAQMDGRLDAFAVDVLRAKLTGQPRLVHFDDDEHRELCTLIAGKTHPKLGPYSVHLLASPEVLSFLRSILDAGTLEPA